MGKERGTNQQLLHVIILFTNVYGGKQTSCTDKWKDRYDKAVVVLPTIISADQMDL